MALIASQDYNKAIQALELRISNKRNTRLLVKVYIINSNYVKTIRAAEGAMKAHLEPSHFLIISERY